MQVLSLLALVSLTAAQGVTFTPTTAGTLSFSDSPEPVTSSSYSATLTFPSGGGSTETPGPEPEPEPEPEPDKPEKLPTLVSASYSGSGCPQGSVNFPDNANINNTAFELPEFDLNNSGPMNKTKNCQIHLNLEDSPEGWQFAVKEVRLSEVEYHLQDEAALRLWFTTFFSADAANTLTLQYKLAVNGMRYLVLSIPDESLLWSTCGGNYILNMNLRVQIDDSSVEVNSRGSTTFGTEPFLERFGYTWQKCGGAKEDENPSSTIVSVTEPVLTLTDTPLDKPTLIEPFSRA